ncbi:MAG TPA: cyclic nucleotide-binding domain-containing protein [Candidatus Hydrogenedentes bacterium]|nr:cyclic nucleotide-binding domain-containing protein [Candidatus Hydrogenedentota bacterium]HIJ74171.1 cyclic nucleotide-binding domain-containing protein [Candidatus Hydrogenedentota bacterium]
MADKNLLKELLKRVECFSELDKASLALLEEKTQLQSFDPADVIFSEGERGDRLYIVKSGEVRVFKKDERGNRVEIDALGPGDFGGATSLFLDEPRSATLEARGRVELWVLDRVTFQRLLESNSAMAKALLTFMSRHARKESTILAKLQSLDRETGLKVAVFDAKTYTQRILEARNKRDYGLTFFDHRLTFDTASSAMGYKVACVFVNDTVDAFVVERLKEMGVELIALRCAGYNNVDIAACERCGISVVRVPAYSPHSVAEHSIALMMALNRRIYRAYNRVREGNFALDGLVGFEIHGKTVGVIGTGRIGRCAVEVLLGFGCRILALDKFPNTELANRPGLQYTTLEALLRQSDIISLYVPLAPETRHLIDAKAIAEMKRGVMIINTSRGALIDTQALIDGLKSGQVGSAGLDVYEEESEYFFEDFSDAVITDDVLARLMGFGNVIVTSHMAFLTHEALVNIADTTFDNIKEYEDGKRGRELTNGVCSKCA